MSYSFTICGATKAEAKRLVEAELARVRQDQPAHAIDYAQAWAAAEVFIDLMPDDPSKDVVVGMYGYVSLAGTPEDPVLSSASVSITASSVQRIE